MPNRKVHRGGCLCGAIRFEVTGPVNNSHSCSCKMCQRHSGAPTAVWVEFPSDAVRWIGEAGAPATYRSSEFSSRAFCPVCGSSIGAIDEAPVVALLVGTFDRINSKELKPTRHSYRSARPKWWNFMIDCSRSAASRGNTG